MIAVAAIYKNGKGPFFIAANKYIQFNEGGKTTWTTNLSAHGPLKRVAFTRYLRPGGTKKTEFDVEQAVFQAFTKA